MKKEMETTTVPAIAIPEMDKTEVKKTRGIYRTKGKAGDTDEIPGYLPVITDKNYRYALTVHKNDTAYMQLLSPGNELNYKNDILYLNGKSVNYGELNKMSTEDGIEKINFVLLLELYGVILCKFLKNDNKSECMDEEFTVYYPGLASRFRKPKKKNETPGIKASDDNTDSDDGDKNNRQRQEDADILNRNMAFFQRMAGIINIDTAQVILPVITDYKYDLCSNTIRFRSPYMARLLTEIFKANIKKDKNGRPVIKKNGQPDMLPSHSFLVDKSIAKERNKKAVEIVLILVVLIEEAGNTCPHIKAKTIIDRTCLLKHSLEGQNTSNKNLMLKRAFSKALELLAKKTSIKHTYKGIQLPDPAVVPVSSMLDMVFSFPHGNKKRNNA
ncbi:MAG: hypothetical protein HFH68_00625 [Lachnospiraceae bacterium]|nr:hypothetical protein [Lachnospiraceae bacterium]